MYLSDPQSAEPPQRIVSLVPSITELLSYLQLAERVKGITKFCVHPAAWHQSKSHVGGTKNLNMKKIDEISPDLVIANREENTKEQIDELATKYPVWLTEVDSYDSALSMIGDIGSITQTGFLAGKLREEIQEQFATLTCHVKRKTTVYLIWKDPFMCAGGDTFVDAMLEKAGFENAFKYQQRYPVINYNDLNNPRIELVFLSSEPYPFKEKDRVELQHLLPHCRIVLVDGESFSWYGSRMLKAARYFKGLQARVYNTGN